LEGFLPFLSFLPGRVTAISLRAAHVSTKEKGLTGSNTL
jgi:hypothetical protein